MRTISGHSEWVRCVVPSDDGKYLASGSKDHVSGLCLEILLMLILINLDDPHMGPTNGRVEAGAEGSRK